MPYAPALNVASKSPRCRGGNARLRARKSPDSQMGPTTSTFVVPGISASIIGRRRRQTRGRGGRPDAMERIVERWPDEIVHGTVLDDKMLAAGIFRVNDARQQNARIADDEPHPAPESACTRPVSRPA